MVEPLLEVAHLGALVERDGQATARAQRAGEGGDGGRQLRRGQVHQRVPRRDQRPARSGRRGGQPVRSATSKRSSGNRRRASATMPSARSNPVTSAPAAARWAVICPGPQPTSATGPPPASVGEALEQPAVEGLAIELVEQLVGVGAGDGAVGVGDVRVPVAVRVGSAARRPARGVGASAVDRAEEVGPPSLLLARLPLLLLDERLVAGGERAQRGVDLLQVGEGVQALGPAAELARRLRAAQQQQREDGPLAAVEAEHLVEHLAVLRLAGAVARVQHAGEPRGPQAVEGGLHLELARATGSGCGPRSGCRPSAAR